MYDYDVIISFITAFTLTYFVIPSIIRIALKKKLYDVPVARSSHTKVTPRLGGIAIFAGTIFSILLWTPFARYGGDLQYVLCAFILIFLVGIKDDIDGIAPSKKLVVEVLAAAILAFKAGIYISGLHGIMGIQSIGMFWGTLLTVFVIIVIINAINLIDGINGLSGSLVIIITGTMGIWFMFIQRYDLAIMAVSAAGATAAFLKYNFSPARIFMGDTGALLLGLICSILTINFIELNGSLPDTNPFKLNAAPAVAIGILILPLFDTLRVFLTRILRGRHPLHPDRTHIHHLLLDSGLDHMQATAVLVLVNVFFIALVFLLQRYTDNAILLILLLTGIASIMAGGLFYQVKRRKKMKLGLLKKKTATLSLTGSGHTQNIH
ncbi:MAG TPA: undecaprenyl/decaprenyl-phosphate alpha-N-acetylglucosaminyl 1-phosphate transferase, partial [Bacteroidetes bacterium]|nr:undecaprenyl/decaprenyl-phosphate alpha-N-acetylglucosaminyl 1-phosphate transferase [Bacteroidota bacterium]